MKEKQREIVTFSFISVRLGAKETILIERAEPETTSIERSLRLDAADDFESFERKLPRQLLILLATSVDSSSLGLNSNL